MITVEDMVRREVQYCVSYLVSTLAINYGALDTASMAMNEITEQAFDLACPIDDWEEAAREAGAKQVDQFMWEDSDGHAEVDAQEMCNWLGVEPHQREVFEHWIVSDWLADQLATHGEKVDKDFAGMTVWARTTTGQGIAMDSVIQAIHAELVGASGESV